MIKVLHVIPSLSPLRGGAAVALLESAHQISRQHVEVHIATTDDHGPGRVDVPLGRPVEREGCTIRYFPRQTRLYSFSGPLTAWLWSHTREYDLVHVHALFSYPSAAGSASARWHSIPYIVEPLGTLNRWGMTRRRPLLKQLSFHLVERRVIKAAAAVRFTSSPEADEAARLGVAMNVVIIPLGIDTTPFDTLPGPEQFFQLHPTLRDRARILFVSRLDPKKGVELLLDGVAVLRRSHPDIALVVAGDGEPAYVASLHARAQELGIADNVVWTGFLEGDDKLAALAAASVFALPSYSENFGLAAVEALAAGVPSVLSDRVAISREAARGEAALIVPCDAGSLSVALDRLLSDSALAHTLSARGPKLVRDCFSVEQAARSLAGLYQGIVAARASPNV